MTINQALAQIHGKVTIERNGVITPTECLSVPDEEAIDYLCREWDYIFIGGRDEVRNY